jgi:hypothetical protein
VTCRDCQDREKFRNLLDAAMDIGLQVREKENPGVVNPWLVSSMAL